MFKKNCACISSSPQFIIHWLNSGFLPGRGETGSFPNERNHGFGFPDKKNSGNLKKWEKSEESL